MLVNEVITEGKHDPHTFKAIFMIGSPGSGKSTVARKIAAGTGLKMVNSDTVYEWLTTGTDMPIITKGYDDELYRHSNRLVRKQMDTYIDGRLGLLIDSTGKKVTRMKELKERLEALGYETMAVFVNTDINTALDRNEQRRRKVDTEWVRSRHAEIQSNLGDYQNLFAGRLVIVDNNDGANLEQAIPHAAIRRFLNRPPRMHQAKKWLGEGLGKLSPMSGNYARELKELAAAISSLAQPWIQATGLQKKVYRGFQKGSVDYLKILSPRENRHPLNSPPELHEYWNRTIQEKGLAANRSNSFFVTGDRGFAEGYGEVYIGIPLGNFNYTWAPDFRDWYLVFHRALKHLVNDPADVYSVLTKIDNEDDESKINIKQKFEAHLRGDDGSIVEAIESGNEILLHADKVLFLHRHLWRDLIEHHGKTLGL